MTVSFMRYTFATVLLPLITACAVQPTKQAPVPQPANVVIKESELSAPVSTAKAERGMIYKGTGVLVRGEDTGGAVPQSAPTGASNSPIVLNFEGADLREVVR